MSEATNAPLLYGVMDAARALGVGRSTIYRLIADGQLEARALGGRPMIPATRLHAFVAGLPPARINVSPGAAKPAGDPFSGPRGGG